MSQKKKFNPVSFFFKFIGYAILIIFGGFILIGVVFGIKDWIAGRPVIPAIVFLLAAFVSAFRSRTGDKITVDNARFGYGGCGCFSLVATLALGALLYFKIIPQFPFGATLMLILAAVGIIIGALVGLFTDQTKGKGSYDFSVSLITATFFWVATSYLYYAVFRLTFQFSLSSILVFVIFIVGESIVVYWIASLLKNA